MKKGFTLVELLAVIIILGLLSALIAPKVINSINDSERKVNMSNAQNLLNTAIYKSANNDIQGTNQTIIINYTTGENKDYLDYSGKKPEAGQIIIKANGKIEMAIKIGDYCYKKNTIETDITVLPYSSETCITITPEIVPTGDGLYESTTDPGRLIYRGANPNNYINIKEDGTNNTLYRIVSYEPDGTIKVVRNESIGNKAWDAQNARYSDGTNNTYCTSEYGCNVWGNQTNTLYDGSSLGDNFHYMYYASASATTLTNGDSGKVGSDSTLNQYLNSKTNNTTNSWQPAIVLDNYIDNHSWNVGGVYYTSDDKGIIKEKEEEKQLQWIGKIALLNATEFIEASTNSSCTNTRSSMNSDFPCKKLNWAFKGIDEWFLSPNAGTRGNVWYVNSHGYFYVNCYAYSTIGVRPAFYLKADIDLTGEGTETNPYRIIGM